MDIRNNIRKNYKYVLLILFTIILCPVLARFIGPKSDYVIICNTIIVLLIVIALFNMIIKKKKFFYGEMTLCGFALLVSNNHLYSSKQLQVYFPSLKNANQMLVVIIVIMLFFILFSAIRFIRWLNTPENSSENDSENNDESNTSGDENATNNAGNTIAASNGNTPARNTKIDKIFSGIASMMSVIIVVSITLFSMYFFITKKNIVDMFTQEMLENYINSIVIIISILMLTMVVVLTVVEAAHIIKRSIRKILHRNNNNANQIPNTFLTSSVIFFILLYFAYNSGMADSISSLDDLFNFSFGNKIALPVTLLLLLTIFIIFIHLIDYVIQSWDRNRDRIYKKMKKIVHLMINIVIDSITSALKFIKFIPNYFSYMYDFVMNPTDDFYYYINNEEITNCDENRNEDSSVNQLNSIDNNTNENITE